MVNSAAVKSVLCVFSFNAESNPAAAQTRVQRKSVLSSVVYHMNGWEWVNLIG